MKTKNFIGILFIAIVIFSCGERKQSEDIKVKGDYLTTEKVVVINGISVLDSFNIDTYIEKIGEPDTVIRGGQEIIEEFGADDFDLIYNSNRLVAGHGYLLSAYIIEPGISVNNLDIGDSQKEIEETFDIPHIERDTIKIINSNDDILIFYMSAQKTIEQIEYQGSVI